MFCESIPDSPFGCFCIERTDSPGDNVRISFADHLLKVTQTALALLQRVDGLAQNIVFILEVSTFNLSANTLFNVRWELIW
jgi:hypothetical protein